MGTSLSSMPKIEEEMGECRDDQERGERQFERTGLNTKATWIAFSSLTFLLSLALKNHKWILEELI